MFFVKTLHEQRMISTVTLHVTLNVIRSGNQNKAGAPCFSTGMMSKLTTSNLCEALM